LYSRRSFLFISLAFENPLSITLSLYPRLMKWIHSDKELDEFFKHANNIHPSIKFTHEVSKTKMSFLDTNLLNVDKSEKKKRQYNFKSQRNDKSIVTLYIYIRLKIKPNSV
jgi:hypothetical protein